MRLDFRFGNYCGSDAPDAADVDAGVGVDELGLAVGLGDAGFATGLGLCEVGATGIDFGGSGIVVIALSGFSRWSLLGPSPSLIKAR